MKGFLSFSGSDDTFFNVAMPWVKLMDENEIKVASIYSNPVDLYKGQYSTSAMHARDFYVGLITVKGKTLERALNEWKVALESDKPTILLLDDKVKLPEGVAFNSSKVIRFNKNNPQKAIQLIETQMAKCRPFTNEKGVPVINRVAGYFCCLSALTIIQQLTKLQKVQAQEAVLAA